MRPSMALFSMVVVLGAFARNGNAQYTVRPLDPGDGGVPRWGRPAGGVPGPAPILLSQASAAEALNFSRIAKAGTPLLDYAIYGASRHRYWVSYAPGSPPNGVAAALTWDSRLALGMFLSSTPGFFGNSWQFAVYRPEQITVDAEGRPQFPCDLVNGVPPTPLGSPMFSAPALLGDDIDPLNYNNGIPPISLPTGLRIHVVPALVPDPAYTGAQNPALSPMGAGATRAVYHLQIYGHQNTVTWTTNPTPIGPVTAWWPNNDGQLGFLRVTVTVDNYREPTASVSNVTVVTPWTAMLDTAGNPVGGATFPIKEPTATFDGRLVICAPGDRIMYTYNSNPSSPNGWTPLRDLNHLYTDAQGSIPALNTYPLARARLRGPDGALIPQASYNPVSLSDTNYFKGAYPWVTPDGDALIQTIVKPPADSLRTGLIYFGSQTDHRLYLIDGSLNPDRESSARLVSAGLSLSPGFWDVLRDANAGQPMRPGTANRTRIAAVNVSGAHYGEIDLASFRDPDVIAFLPMNEELRHHPGPTTVWHYDAHRWDHDPTSTLDIRGGRRGVLVGAKFPVEHHNPTYVSTPHTFNNNTTLPPDVDYNAGFVGNAIFFWPGDRVEVPYDVGLGWTGSFTARCFFRPEAVFPSSGSSYVDLVSMVGKFRLGVTFDRRVFGEIVLPGVGTMGFKTNTGTVPGQVWYHLALTYDQPTGIMKLWVDGVEQVTASTTPQAATASGAAPLVLGPASSSGDADAPWLRLDEVGLDKVARKAEFLWDAAYRPPQPPAGVAPTPALVAQVPLGLDPNDLFAPLGSVPWSADLAELGEDLFLDPKLSTTDTMSCASCHDPATAFASANAFDTGVTGVPMRRHTPTVVNRAFSAEQFWDGHAQSLEDQAIRPIVALDELGFANVQTFLSKIESIPGYAAEFQTLFGGSAPFVTQPRVEAALAAFQRSLMSGASSFDLGQMTTSGTFGNAVRGEQLFRGKARCSSCHFGPNFTDELFHNTASDHGANDSGRAEVTGYALDDGAFKTPTLRDTMRRSGSLFHDGSHDIDEVLAFYDQGGVHQHVGGTPDGVVDPDMVPLNLTAADKADLKEFLKALNGAPIVVANPPDVFEPNDVYYAAPHLVVGDSASLDLTVRDFDFFIVTGPATVDITFSNVDGNLDLFAANPALQLVAVSASTTSDVETVAIPSGPHVVLVWSLVGATNVYDIKVSP
jgi:cytochrome c peroxidase